MQINNDILLTISVQLTKFGACDFTKVQDESACKRGRKGQDEKILNTASGPGDKILGMTACNSGSNTPEPAPTAETDGKSDEPTGEADHRFETECVGVTIVMVSGGSDMSVGGQAALSGLVMAWQCYDPLLRYARPQPRQSVFLLQCHRR